MKTPSKGMLQLDSIIQGVLIIPILIAYVAAIPAQDFSIFLPLMIQFILGVYQLSSAFIRMLRHGSPFRKNYLIVSIGYVLFIIVAGNILASTYSISDFLAFFLGITGLMVIPMVMALFYWYRTIQQARGKFEETVGFKKQEDLVNLEIENAEDRIVEEIIMRQKNRIKK